jgi:hypothetical protein
MRRKGARKLAHLLARERDGIVCKYIKFLISLLISEYIRVCLICKPRYLSGDEITE